MYRKEKSLVVNKEKYVVYRYMLEQVIEGNMTPYQVAWELNKQKIASPRSGRWHCETVRRILTDETHLGRIISNKSAGDGHTIKQNKDSKSVVFFPREEWFVVENCHVAVKTQKEHNKLLLTLGREVATLNRKGSRIYTLSGLLKCSRCGRTMVVEHRDKKGGERIRACWYRDENGGKCGNGGSLSSGIRVVIAEQLALYEDELRKSLSGDIGDDAGVLRDINMTLTKITKLEKKILKVDEGYEDDYYTLTEAKKRKADIKIDLDQAETMLSLLQLKLNDTKKMSNQERLNIITRFKEEMLVENLTDEKINELYKLIISHIVWDKRDDTIVMQVNFL